MRKGDVVYLKAPPPDRQNPSRVQAGSRPAVIVQNDSAITALHTVVLVPLTGRLKAKRFPDAVVVMPTVLNGLSQASVALIHQITTVDKQTVDRAIGELDSADLERVELAIANFLELPGRQTEDQS